MVTAFYVVKEVIGMLLKECPRCKRIHKQGETCDKVKERHKEYDKTQRNKARDAFYHSHRWKKIREAIKSKFFGLDAYQWIVNKVMVKGTTIHHIIPLADAPEKAMDLNNLILLSEETHNEIHAKYREGKQKELEELLLKIVRTWNKNMFMKD